MKRLFDLVIAFVCLLLLSPLLLVLSVVIYFDVKGPLFRQQRIGQRGQVFHLYKFKSMRDIDPNKGLVSNTSRVTPLGRFIRKSSLDELPSLLNIIKGELSFVGPRPLLVDYLPFYKERHLQRHEVKPGLTGLAQINGRNATSWEKRLNKDIEYVNTQSFWLDMKILWLTFFVVLSRRGVESKEDLSIIRLDQDTNYINSN